MNGVEGMLYMSSTSAGDGSYSLTVTFEVGTDLNQAQVLVQNRTAAAEPQLPEEIRRQGITVRKQSTSIVLAVSRASPEGEAARHQAERCVRHPSSVSRVGLCERLQ